MKIETKALIEVSPKGKTSVLYEAEPELFVPLESLIKKKKEKGKVAVEEVKKIGKKEKVKAFLKKVIEKKQSQKSAKENIRILKLVIDVGKKALETHVRGFSKKDNDASQFWSLVEVKMSVADSNSSTFKFIRSWFYDALSHKVKGGYATDYTDAPQDYINDILSGLYRSLTTSKGKMVKLWEQDVEPPYSSRISLEQIEEFREIFPSLTFDEEVNLEDEEEDDVPYNYKIFARSS